MDTKRFIFSSQLEFSKLLIPKFLSQKQLPHIIRKEGVNTCHFITDIRCMPQFTWTTPSTVSTKLKRAHPVSRNHDHYPDYSQQSWMLLWQLSVQSWVFQFHKWKKVTNKCYCTKAMQHDQKTHNKYMKIFFVSMLFVNLLILVHFCWLKLNPYFSSSGVVCFIVVMKAGLYTEGKILFLKSNQYINNSKS